MCLETALSRYSNVKVLKKCDQCGNIHNISYRRTVDNYEKYSSHLCTSCSKKINPNNRIYHYDRSFFKNIDCEEKAYFLGWVASDGWMEKDRVCIAVHKRDKEILDKLRDIICPHLPIANKDVKTVCLRISSHEIVSDICKWLSVSPGSKFATVRFPKLLDKSLNCHFMRGLFDGDGHIRKSNVKGQSLSCCLRSSSPHMRDSVMKIFGGTEYKNSVNWCLKSGAISFLDEIYFNCKWHLNRKLATYNNWKDHYESVCSNVNSKASRR